ncbi:stereocilin isoform X1 [Hippoglossus hippoglossus]|uniref:stereocilin isoform X1 n=1 Tax=Hippoglossus hippoglossus TaxID=8267 RepID=UPI00148B3886|nr:stereocilin isoform X1 [Hippoglossus hippoglossus]
MSGRQDCGLEAELTKAVTLKLGRPLLAFVSSLRSQTCSPLSRDTQSSSFSRAYLGMGESVATAFTGFQQTLINILSVPLSGNFMGAASGLVDAAVTNVLRLMATLLQEPMDYIKIALQFGISVPSLDRDETCQQGDLKQLIMWGINHNVSWSFSNSIVDILLEIFLAPQQPPCTYPGPECQSPPSILFQRSVSEAAGDGHDILLECDRHNLARLNDTLCADILAGSRSSMSVLAFCQALNSLSVHQMQQVWSNMCYVIRELASPLSRSTDCSVGDVRPSPATPPSSLTVPLTAPRRVAREATNLRQLACNYSSWSENEVVDAVLVTLCSDNEREQFVRRVCSDAPLMGKLLSDRMNSWLYAYCANSSADPGYLVSHFCVYGKWFDQPTVLVGPHLLEFCMNLDGPTLTKHICWNTGFFVMLFSHPENFQFMPNCSVSPPAPPFPDPDSLILDSCRYSEWRDVAQIPMDVLMQCVSLDRNGFIKEVCANQTFLNNLLLNTENDWLESLCETSHSFLPTEPSPPLNTADWCDYHTWGERPVDESVVGLCWNNDQLAFQKNVCCSASVLEKLLENPQNQWLVSVCRDIDDMVSPQVCKYSEWTYPIMVDMTELALCSEIDPLNFTSIVCANQTILHNLLTNQDNTWLIQHCANRTDSGVSPGGDGDDGEDLAGFNPAEQCLYSSWSVALPDVSLLTLCWEHDQTNFVSSVCPNSDLLLLLSQEPSSMWVSSMCTTYTNYTTATTTNATTNATNLSTTAQSDSCLARKLVRQFNWNCSADFTSACRPGASQSMALQMMLRCWVESLRPRVEDLLTPPVAAVLEQAVSTTVVFLLALEEVQNTSLHVIKNIRLNVLESVGRYLEREKDFGKKRVVLQCFGTVLTSLMQTARDMTTEDFFFIKEYFRVPLSSLRSVLSATNITTVRLILQYYSRNKDTLQLPDQYLPSMMSVLLHTHVKRDVSLFPELAPLLASVSPADIQALPPLQNDVIVRQAINSNLGHMTLDQREAFGLWYSKDMPPSKITKGHQSLIRDTGNLIAYLPFRNFQHLSSAQLVDGLDVLQESHLTALKQEFIAQSLVSSYRNLTAQDFIRLGKLSCLADPEDLLLYRGTEAFGVIQHFVMNCTREGLSLPNHLISSLLLSSTEFNVPSSLSADRLAEVAHLMPLLGVTFLQGLTPPQLGAVLPALSSTSFSPAQASVIVDKLTSITAMTAPGQLQKLGSLIVGVKTETFLTLTSDMLLSSLPAMAQQTPGLSPPVANSISTNLWGFPEVVTWLDDVEPLLNCTPLLSVLPRTRLLVNNIANITTKPFNTQQAIAIFREALDTKPNLILQHFLSLGTLGQGVSCKVLKKLFQADSSPSAVIRILLFLRQQPGPLHTSLKTCVIDELYQLEFFSELLKDLGAEIALSMPMSTINKFSTAEMDALRQMVIQDPRHFLLLPRKKQQLLVDKMAQRMSMYTGVFTEEEFRSLGVMAPFVVDEVFIHVDRSFFIDNLDFLLGLCYSRSKMELVARILQEPAVFGPVNNWNQTTLSQVDRFLFFLPDSSLQDISMALMTLGHIEKLFMMQRRWEHGPVGSRCLIKNERMAFFHKQQFVLQFFLGFLRINPLSPTPIVPTCELLRSITPAAWTDSSLTSMSSSAFSNCLELMGHDPFFSSYQHRQLLQKVKQMYGPVSSFSPSVISQLGGLALELTLDELSSLRLIEQRSIAALGAVSDWSNRQLAALFTTVLNSTKRTPSQLDSSTLVAMGHIVCGAKDTEIKAFNAVEFSKAVLFLGQLTLSCSEEQLDALVGLLTHSLAFGLISSWGTDVFIEIGVLAAGLPDFAMSALVKEQIEGITPLAISMISTVRFSVALNHIQISMFSYEQAAAVTPEQFSALSDVQRTALAMALTPWENRPINFRGKSLGLALSHSPLCLVLGLLMLLIVLPDPDLPWHMTPLTPAGSGDASSPT